MRAGILRASVATGLFALLVLETVPVGALRAQAPGAQQNPQQKPPVTVPAGPSGETKPPDQYSISVDVPLVTLDVVVSDDKGDIYPGLHKGNFRVSEDGVLQPLTNFSTPDAPITTVLLIEFSSRGYGFYARNSVVWAD